MVSHQLKRLDLYGETIGFRVDGQEKVRTIPGMLVSICVYFLIFIFVLQRLAYYASGHHWYFIDHLLDFEGMDLSEEQIEAL